MLSALVMLERQPVRCDLEVRLPACPGDQPRESAGSRKRILHHKEVYETNSTHPGTGRTGG